MRQRLIGLLAVVTIVAALGIAYARQGGAGQDQVPPGMGQDNRPGVEGQGPGQPVPPMGQRDQRVFPGMPGFQMAQPGPGATCMVVDGAHNAVYVCMGDTVYRLNATTLKQEAVVRLQPPARERPRLNDMPPPSGGEPGR